jgi:hypothetical protein
MRSKIYHPQPVSGKARAHVYGVHRIGPGMLLKQADGAAFGPRPV